MTAQLALALLTAETYAVSRKHFGTSAGPTSAAAQNVVYDTAYIGCREETEDLEDDSAMGHIMAYLSHATTEEKDALVAFRGAKGDT